MSSLTFHKCRICGCIFYHGSKDTYCAKCIPSFVRSGKAYSYALNNMSSLERRRARERARWRIRMSDPVFREHERIRSLNRARAERKYAVKGEE